MSDPEKGLRRPGPEENESGHPLEFVSQALYALVEIRFESLTEFLSFAPPVLK